MYIDRIDRNILSFIEDPDWANRYAALEGVSFKENLYDEMAKASGSLFRLFARTTKITESCDSSFLKNMDIPEKLRPFVPQGNRLGLPTYISRFDFVMNEAGELKMVELNADTPCAIPETFYGNRIYCEEEGFVDPNKSHYGDLQAMFMELFSAYKDKLDNDGVICFSCFHDYREDLGNAMFLKSEAEKAAAAVFPNPPEVVFESFYDLQLDDNGLLTKAGRRISFLYRLHPLELLVEEKGYNGEDIGVELLTHAKEGRVVLMNPASSILVQNKGFQALVWSLAGTDVYTDAEKALVKKYMLPSFFEYDPFYEGDLNGKDYIVKPIWGREGSGLSVYSDGECVYEKKARKDLIERESISYLYQEYVPPKQFVVRTDEGTLTGNLTLSCFVLNGRPSGFFARFTDDMAAGIEAYWVPLSQEGLVVSL